MFFFAFANAGVKVSQPGGLTISIILALVAGKTLGIAGFAIGGDLLGKLICKRFLSFDLSFISLLYTCLYIKKASSFRRVSLMVTL